MISDRSEPAPQEGVPTSVHLPPINHDPARKNVRATRTKLHPADKNVLPAPANVHPRRRIVVSAQTNDSPRRSNVRLIAKDIRPARADDRSGKVNRRRSGQGRTGPMSVVCLDRCAGGARRGMGDRQGDAMSHSFFLGTDAEVLSGSRAFSAKINAAWADYGLLESQALAYAELNAIYEQAYLKAIAPGTRTRGTVIAKRDAKAKLKVMASDLAKIIAGQVQVSDAQRQNLSLSVRKPREPVGAPGKPFLFRWTLTTIGSLDLQWKCKHPPGASGTTYKISRRINGESTFTFLGVTGRRRFSDVTVPAGTASVTYQVQAIRSTKVGEIADFNVNFGVNTHDAAFLAAVAASTPTRMAA
jgi:hypothetical protein